MKKKSWGFVVCSILLITHCGCGSSTGSGTTSGTSGVSLTTSDFPDDGVCSGSINVTTDSFKAAMAALTSFIFLHETYSSDADIPFICGLQGTWNPGTAGAFAAQGTVPLSDTTTSAIQTQNLMICNTGFDFTQLDYGFNDAGTYRGEFTFTDGTTTHRARMRYTVTGTNAGRTLASLGLTLADISLTDGNDNALTNISNVRDLFAAGPTSMTIKVKSGGANGTTHITATGGVICAKVQ